MLNCYCQLSSSVIFRQYRVSQSECKIDRPRPGLSRLSPRPHMKVLGTRLGKPHISILSMRNVICSFLWRPPPPPLRNVTHSYRYFVLIVHIANFLLFSTVGYWRCFREEYVIFCWHMFFINIYKLQNFQRLLTIGWNIDNIDNFSWNLSVFNARKA
jgi:hypothetical protein